MARDERSGARVTVSTVTIAGKEYVVVPRKDFERLRRKAELLSDADAVDLEEGVRRLADPKEKRVAWERVKRRAGLK